MFPESEQPIISEETEEKDEAEDPMGLRRHHMKRLSYERKASESTYSEELEFH